VSALQTPAPDAPAAEWGALAFSIPGWSKKYQQPREQLVDDDGIEWIYSDQSDWFNGGSGYPVPNPDHDGTAGCLLALLGPCEFAYDDADPACGPWSVAVPSHFRMGSSIGRACIAVAAALGRWPGGGE